MSKLEETLQQRGSVHGRFEENSAVLEILWTALQSGTSWKSLTSVQKNALWQISSKMSRIVSGDPNHADHWHDIGGYAKLAEDRIVTQTKFETGYPLVHNVKCVFCKTWVTTNSLGYCLICHRVAATGKTSE